jgi:hypothetical protein
LIDPNTPKLHNLGVFKARLVSIFMLFVFSVFMLKSAFFFTSETQNCNEFAHIHNFNFHKIADHKEHVQDYQTQDKDESCHAASILSGIYIFIEDIFMPVKINVRKIQFKLSSVDNLYVSPDLAKHRQPPKKA